MRWVQKMAGPNSDMGKTPGFGAPSKQLFQTMGVKAPGAQPTEAPPTGSKAPASPSTDVGLGAPASPQGMGESTQYRAEIPMGALRPPEAPKPGPGMADSLQARSSVPPKPAAPSPTSPAAASPLPRAVGQPPPTLTVPRGVPSPRGDIMEDSPRTLAAPRQTPGMGDVRINDQNQSNIMKSLGTPTPTPPAPGGPGTLALGRMRGGPLSPGTPDTGVGLGTPAAPAGRPAPTSAPVTKGAPDRNAFRGMGIPGRPESPTPPAAPGGPPAPVTKGAPDRNAFRGMNIPESQAPGLPPRPDVPAKPIYTKDEQGNVFIQGSRGKEQLSTRDRNSIMTDDGARQQAQDWGKRLGINPADIQGARAFGAPARGSTPATPGNNAPGGAPPATRPAAPGTNIAAGRPAVDPSWTRAAEKQTRDRDDLAGSMFGDIGAPGTTPAYGDLSPEQQGEVEARRTGRPAPENRASGGPPGGPSGTPPGAPPAGGPPASGAAPSVAGAAPGTAQAAPAGATPAGIAAMEAFRRGETPGQKPGTLQQGIDAVRREAPGIMDRIKNNPTLNRIGGIASEGISQGIDKGLSGAEGVLGIRRDGQPAPGAQTAAPPPAAPATSAPATAAPPYDMDFGSLSPDVQAQVMKATSPEAVQKIMDAYKAQQAASKTSSWEEDPVAVAMVKMAERFDVVGAKEEEPVDDHELLERFPIGTWAQAHVSLAKAAYFASPDELIRLTKAVHRRHRE